MATSLIRRIHVLRQMTVGELREEWEALYGEPTRSRNRDYLWRRLAWRVQELAHGGLSDQAQSKVEALATDAFTRARTPPGAVPEPQSKSALSGGNRPPRDPRLPAPGTVLTREYHGREIRVVALDDGYEWEGRRYGSLSALARKVTGQKWNGWLFFGLTERKRNR